MKPISPNATFDWLKGNVFNIITTVVMIAGVFLALNDRVTRLEEKVLSASERDITMDKKVDEIRSDVKELRSKQDELLKYLIEHNSEKELK